MTGAHTRCTSREASLLGLYVMKRHICSRRHVGSERAALLGIILCTAARAAFVAFLAAAVAHFDFRGKSVPFREALQGSTGRCYEHRSLTVQPSRSTRKWTRLPERARSMHAVALASPNVLHLE